MTGSLAYRKNRDAIVRGEVPAKYTRLLAHIPGTNVLEIGSAEGVLANVMAKAGKKVVAFERSVERDRSAHSLSDQWLRRQPYRAPYLVNADIIHNLWAMEGGIDGLDSFDTLVAVRVIYYLRQHLDAVFAAAAAAIPNVVLCGNAGRAATWRSGTPDNPGGAENYYASHEGMTDVLRRHGYDIVTVVTDGDPIVVGRK